MITSENLSQALESARCTQINLDNLVRMIPGLGEHPFLKIVALQLEDTIKLLETAYTPITPESE